MPKLPPQFPDDLRAEMSVGASDVAAARAFVASAKAKGKTLNPVTGALITISAEKAKPFWLALEEKAVAALERTSTLLQIPYQWRAASAEYVTLNGTIVPPITVKASAEVVVAETRFKMNDILLKLQQNAAKTRLSDEAIDAAFREFKAAHKLSFMAQRALARGGWAQVPSSDWLIVEADMVQQVEGVAGKFPGMRAFFQDIAQGRYGASMQSTAANVRAALYPEAGRAYYENTRLQGKVEIGDTYAVRIKGAVDSCPTCIAEAGKIRPIDKVVPIGQSECGIKCHCIIETGTYNQLKP